MQNFDDPVDPPLLGHYRDDRRNVFIDGNSNLVLRATQEGGDYFSGKVLSNFHGQIGTTWEARIKLDCMTPGNWPAYWLVNQDPLPDGEIDVMEYYGNGLWAPGTTVHAASNGKTWEGKSIPQLVDNGWHTWRVHWGEEGFQFWRDYAPGAKPYFVVGNTPFRCMATPTTSAGRSASRATGCRRSSTSPSAGPAVATPPAGAFPSTMLIDWIRVW